MKDNLNGNGYPPRKRDESARGEFFPEARPHASGNGGPEVRANGHAPASNFNIWVALDLLLHRWHWPVLGTLVCGAAFYVLGFMYIRPKFLATAQLIRYEAPGKSETFKTTPISSETFAGLIRSPDLLRRVGDCLMPPVAPETLAKALKIDPEPDSDIVNVIIAGLDPESAVHLLNLYLTNAVAYTSDLEAKQAGLLANAYLKKQVAEMDQDISEVREQILKAPFGSQMTNKLAQVGDQVKSLHTAMGELNDLLIKYTDIHPLVQAKKDQIKALEARVNANSGDTNLTSAALGAPAAGLTEGGATAQMDIINIKLRAFEDARLELLKRQREAELYEADPPGSVRIHAPASLKTVKASLRGLKIWMATAFGGLFGMGAGIVFILLVEFADNRLKTADDLKRVTRLPVLTSLGNLYEMAPEARAQWAFRTWTMLQGRLSPSPNFGLVCGITSSSAREGRSTWISLLAEAASLTGFRVLTIATQPSPTHLADEDSERPLLNDELNHAGDPSRALTSNLLTCPAQVTEQLTTNSQPVVHIPLPGWVWNLDRRKQWRDALNHWRQIENLVIFVELPPASVPEAVLLGSNLPNMLWLADSGSAHAGETRAQLETLRDARCKLVGAVLNHEPAVPIRKRFPRWISCLALAVAVAAGNARAQQTNLPPPESQPQPTAPAAPAESQPQPTAPAAPAEVHSTPTFSIVNPSQRGAWQQHLTLGPGDILNFGLYGQPEVGRAEMAVGPDGRVSYLEAQDVLATGLTIDELRAALDQELGKYRRAPHTVLTPVAFHSKKYFMLGKVTTKGVYTLDRPLTVLEALARAHGLESALVDSTAVKMTDFQRSFLARGGRRIPLNFEKLFQQGDLSQNIPIEPGDYIYFAPGDAEEVYVVGEVRIPGPTPYTSGMSVVAAITGRGGYTARAFKMRVLVIRGSLSNPEKFVVNTHAVLTGRGVDFKLQPKDIIYVNSRPFILVEEAADLAATAFIQAVVTSWVGVDVVRPTQ